MASVEQSREAVRCYYADAHRAAVVLAVAACFDQLRRRLESRAGSGGASRDLRNAAAAIGTRYNSHKSIENQLIEACQPSGPAECFSAAEVQTLRDVLSTRHKCAHPSGHRGQAEEARWVIATVVDLVLSRPEHLGIVKIDELVGRLASPNFFPDEDEAGLVRAEMQKIAPALHPALVRKVGDRFLDEMRRGVPDATVLTNAAKFLGVLFCRQDLSRPVLGVLGQLSHEPAAHRYVEAAVSAQGTMQFAEDADRRRILAVLANSLQSRRVRTTLKAWRERGDLTSVECERIDDAAVRTFAAEPESTDLCSLSELACSRETMTDVVDKLVDAAGHDNWPKANKVVESVQALPSSLVEWFSAEQRVRYLRQIADSVTNVEARYEPEDARKIVRGGLGPRADFAESVIPVLESHPEVLLDGPAHFENLARILVKSDREKVLRHLILAVQPEQVANRLQWRSMLTWAKKVSDELSTAVATVEVAWKEPGLEDIV